MRRHVKKLDQKVWNNTCKYFTFVFGTPNNRFHPKKNTQESNNLRFKFHIVVNVVKSLSFLLFMTYLKHQLKCYNVLYLYKTNFKNFEKNIFIIFLVVFSIYPYLDLESSKKN